MKQFPEKLNKKLKERKVVDALRELGSENELIDFYSNDYLGFAQSEIIFQKAHQFLVDNRIIKNGATGSRLLSGNHKLYNKIEAELCDFHKSKDALVFNSGYDANIGFFSCIPQRGDLILYDEFIHASIRDGIKMSNAKSFKFQHNNLDVLEQLLKRFSSLNQETYIVTESVFSMDGDTPELNRMSKLCRENGVHLIVDEAHAIGVFDGGLVQQLGLQTEVFARIVTFGKAMGCHGAAILGSKKLITYMVNFARSFIYTTGLPPHSLATIKMAYEELLNSKKNSQKLKENIIHFKAETKRLKLNFIESNSAIHCIIISGNELTKTIANKLQELRFDVKPILAPTVPLDEERLRFCLHSYNSKEEITNVLENLATFVV